MKESKIRCDVDSPNSGLEVGIILGYVSADLALDLIVIPSDEHKSDCYIWVFSSGLAGKRPKWPDVSYLRNNLPTLSKNW
jgi:hypothetical protein